MTAVLGGDEAAVLAAIAEAGLTPANVNTAGQIVAGGTLEQLAEFAANPPAGRAAAAAARRGRVPHQAHGPRGRRARRGGRGRPWSRTRRSRCCPTATARSSPPGANWVERIVNQVANPVRWDQCMATMSDIGVTALIELLPGGTLTGMAKRALPGVELLAIKTPDQLDAARALVAAHRDRVAPAHPGLSEGVMIEHRDEDPRRSAGTSRTRWSPTTTWPSSSTPTTSGSGRGSASSRRRVAADDETVTDMAEAAGAKALAASGLEPSDDRPGDRRDLQPPRCRCRTSPPSSPTGSASSRPAPTTSTRPAPGSATRSAHGVRLGARRVARATCW